MIDSHKVQDSSKDSISEIDLLSQYDKSVPHIIKYMGAKKNIIDFVIKSIDELYEGGRLCDLFGGTCVLSGALGKIIPVHSNDIQEYSAILANTYLSDYKWEDYSNNLLEEISHKVDELVNSLYIKFPKLHFCYYVGISIEDFISLEDQQKKLINLDFDHTPYHLFTKYYSGTYWSYDQCIWIDAIRKVADEYSNTPIRSLILSSLMYAMSYTSQSTGHFAQYRDAQNASSTKDILIYRQREIFPYFETKFKSLQNFLGVNNLNHKTTSLDFANCLETIQDRSLVYADPPYAFVHYSRFYHVFETLVKYDYPIVSHKGRYRSDRHQSPFCKRTEVVEAFSILFSKIALKKASLVLSYSNTGMISLDKILEIATADLGYKYALLVDEVTHTHSTMGRKNDKNREVQEYLITAKYSN